MRSTLAVLMLFGALPLVAQEPDPLAFLHPKMPSTTSVLDTYTEQPYRPVRVGEVRSAGFLTEMRALPFGRVLGPVSPGQVHSNEAPEVVLSGMIGIRPPEGAAYQRGDTVLLATVALGPDGWGDIVTPTGIAVVGDHDPRQTLARVITVFGPIRGGQMTLPLEALSNPGAVAPVKASGPSGQVIASQERRELALPGGIFFIDIGKGAGVRVGDFVEVRRKPGPRVNNSDTIDELMAVGQIVHVSEKSSSLKLIRVIAPDISPGTPVVRTATLPN